MRQKCFMGVFCVFVSQSRFRRARRDTAESGRPLLPRFPVVELPVLGGRHFMYLLEIPHEILWIFVPWHLADLVHRQAGVLQEQMRLLEAYLVQQLGEGTAEELFHISGAVGDSVVEMSCQLL